VFNYSDTGRHRPMSYDVVRSVNTALLFVAVYRPAADTTPAAWLCICDSRHLQWGGGSSSSTLIVVAVVYLREQNDDNEMTTK